MFHSPGVRNDLLSQVYYATILYYVNLLFCYLPGKFYLLAFLQTEQIWTNKLIINKFINDMNPIYSKWCFKRRFKRRNKYVRSFFFTEAGTVIDIFLLAGNGFLATIFHELSVQKNTKRFYFKKIISNRYCHIVIKWSGE